MFGCLFVCWLGGAVVAAVVAKEETMQHGGNYMGG